MVFGSHVGCGVLDAAGIHWGDEVRLDDGYCGYPSSRWMDQVLYGCIRAIEGAICSGRKGMDIPRGTCGEGGTVGLGSYVRVAFCSLKIKMMAI